jgi:lipopolysaccharide-induced tumor necrosis factor-alpha factor
MENEKSPLYPQQDVPTYQQASSQSPQLQQTPIIVTQPVFIQFGDIPANVVCPHCQNNITTGIKKENGALIWLSCFGLFVFTACCCWIPFVVDGCKDTVHHCPRCGVVVGRNNRL